MLFLNADFWPLGLRNPLPEIPIPLRNPEVPALLDLQAALQHVYDASGYEDYIYSAAPEPALPVPVDSQPLSSAPADTTAAKTNQPCRTCFMALLLARLWKGGKQCMLHHIRSHSAPAEEYRFFEMSSTSNLLISSMSRMPSLL